MVTPTAPPGQLPPSVDVAGLRAAVVGWFDRECAAAREGALPAVAGLGAESRPSAAASRRRSPSSTPAPFERTSCWLRGRIVDVFRDAPPGAAVRFGGPVASHAEEAVALALRALARDGLVEVEAVGWARLPVASRVGGPAGAPAEGVRP